MGELAASDHIIQGEYRISNRPDSVLTTLLGSCVAACIWDPALKIGGMNHFLLPGEDDAQFSDSERIGVHLMELLVNGLLREGAARTRLQAKLFGGGNMNSSLADIGARNGVFARGFLRNEGISLIGESLGGDQARKVQFWPTTGRARQMQLPKDVQVTDTRRARAPGVADSGSVELF